MRSELDFVLEQRMQRTAKALVRNRMLCTCVGTAEEVAPLIASLIPEGSTIGTGRSATLEACGVTELIRTPRYRFLDRHAPGTEAEKEETARSIAVADYFLASANAITEEGEIYEVDGHASRIGPIAFGPRHVILVAGFNKIVPDLAAAKTRVEQICAPANAKRMGAATPCAVTGTCMHCHSPERICCDTLIISNSRIADRIHVILVKEALGY